MRRIYRFIQQLDKVGGTETVTLQIINSLASNYEVHLVPFIKPKNITYKIDQKVIIEEFSFPSELVQFDVSLNNLIEHHKYYSALLLIFKLIKNILIDRFKFRKSIQNKTTAKDVLIFPSVELMLYAPKNRFVIWHFHYNSKLFNNLNSKILRLLSRKPDLYIFLTNSTKEKLQSKLKRPCTTITNPSRYERVLNAESHNNTLISACRLCSQKNPMLMLKIAKELENLDFKFVYNIYGDGPYKNKMLKFIKNNSLHSVNIISGCRNLKEKYLSSDLYLITSNFEGLPLSCLEANSLSVPIIWKEMGDPTNSFMIEKKNGIIINSKSPKLFAKQIINLFADQKKLSQLKYDTYISASRFEINNIKSKWTEVLDDIFTYLNN